MSKQGVKYRFENTDLMWLLQSYKEKWCDVRKRTGLLLRAPMLEVAQPPRSDLPLKHSFPKTPSIALHETDIYDLPLTWNHVLHMQVSRLSVNRKAPSFLIEKEEGTQFVIVLIFLNLTRTLLALTAGPSGFSLTAYLMKMVAVPIVKSTFIYVLAFVTQKSHEL